MDHGVVLLDLRSGSYFGLDEVGTAVWQAFRNDSTLERVVELLTVSYAVEDAIVRPDILAFVDECTRLGILVAAPEGATVSPTMP
jgi:hypothetical protein